MPRISVLIAVHNEEAFIEAALKSLQEQSLSDFEAIIVDDGSTDATVEKITPFLNDTRFKLFAPGKIGKNNAFNMAYSHATAEWLTYFCGDDLLPDESLEHKYLAACKTGKGKKAIGYSRVKMISKNKAMHGIELPRDKTKGSDSGSAMIFSRALAKIIFPLPDYLPNEDQWTALCGKYFAEVRFHIPKICWYYRIHEQNSHQRNASFDVYSKNYHDRFVVFGHFLAKFRGKLKEDEIHELEQLDQLESARWEGALKKIWETNVPTKEKIRASLYSNPFFYGFRKRFYRLLSGW